VKILIQGAGIAGLALARELQQRQIEFVIFEQARVLEPLGAGITLATNALKCLRNTLDVAALRSKGQSLELMRVHDATGALLSTLATRLADDPFFGMAIHRHHLHAALLDGLDLSRIRLGESIKDIRTSDQDVAATLTDGTVVNGDYLIGADGIRSAVRQFVAPGSRIRFAGDTCWRTVVSHQLRKPEQSVEVWGRGKRLGYIQIAPQTLYIYATLNATERSYASQSTDLARDELRERFADLQGDAVEIVRLLCASNHLIHNDLEELRPVPWSRGRVLLIGDAAHAMTPNLGQGAALSIEDAHMLARIWSSNQSSSSLGQFEQARRNRVAFIQKESWKIGKVAQWTSRPTVWLRNRLIKMVPESSHDRLHGRIFGGLA
jgi:2-heptyl-3-hydroxy-4(1H)-quinolone synthase